MIDLGQMELQRTLVETQQEQRELRTRQQPAIDVICHVYHDANQSINNNTLTTLAFNSERYDPTPYAMHSTVTNNSRITCVVPGRYYIGASIRWAVATGGRRLVRIRLNGTTDIVLAESGSLIDASTVAAQPYGTEYGLVAGDYLEVLVLHTQGAALNVEVQAAHSPEFYAFLLY